MTVQSPDGNAVSVVYETPTLIAGQARFSATCGPQSGSVFPLGASTVACSATDAANRTTSCSFSVTVTRPPQLAATLFMAFGNSITEGKNSFSAPVPIPYPAALKTLLAGRYATQANVLTVMNRGFGGERTQDGAARLPGELDALHPEVLLLEEGVNDLSSGDLSAIEPMIENLRSMVRAAKARGIPVFLATLTPVRAGGVPVPRGDKPLPLIPGANTQIRLLAQSERVVLVDLFEGFGGSPDPYIDVDGLHPNAAGYQKIGQIFFDVIRTSLELPAVARSTELVNNFPGQQIPMARLN